MGKHDRQVIRDWPEAERPRERLIRDGPEALSDAELVAIALGTGTGGMSAVDLARLLLARFGGLRGLDRATASELRQIPGIGPAKAAGLRAALELGKRLLRQGVVARRRIQSVEDVFDYYRPYLRDLKREVFHMMLLDGRNKLIREVTISTGSLTASIVHPREVVKEAIRESAAAVIFVHNHPSGEPEPSVEDIEITERLVDACELVGVRVLDHVIVGDDRYASFVELGLIAEDLHG
ncbi:MAG: DNA repair protein RadC [Candidatus Bipolaricaulia bacterium]